MTSEAKLELRIYENDCDTVIAYSPEDAVAVWDESIGDSYLADGYGAVDDWTLRQGNTLRITDPDEARAVRTHSEWIAKEGRGFLCSTEY